MGHCSGASDTTPPQNWERFLQQSPDRADYENDAIGNNSGKDRINDGIAGQAWNPDHMRRSPPSNAYYGQSDQTDHGPVHAQQEGEHAIPQERFGQEQATSRSPLHRQQLLRGRRRRQSHQGNHIDRYASTSGHSSSSHSLLQRASMVEEILSRAPLPPLPSTQSSEEEQRRYRRVDPSLPTLSFRDAAELYRQGLHQLNARTGGAWRTRPASFREDSGGSGSGSGNVHLSTGPRQAGRALNLPKLSAGQARELLDRFWVQKKITWRLPPREIAKRVALIKLETGYDMQIGLAAARKVKMVMDEEHAQIYRIFQHRYTRRITFLRRYFATDPRFTTDAGRARAVYNKFRKLRPRKYNAVFVPSDAFALHQHQLSMQRAKQIWQYFMTTRVHRTDDSRRRARSEDLSIDQIEYLSRDLQFTEMTKMATTQFLQLYMGQVMQKSDEEMERFGILRAIYRESQQTRGRKQRRRAEIVQREARQRQARGRGRELEDMEQGQGDDEQEEIDEEGYDDEEGDGLIDDGDDEEYGDEEEDE